MSEITTLQAATEKRYLNNKELTIVQLSEKVTEIGDYAFEGCENLETIILPEKLLKIGKFAFYNCKKLKTIEFGHFIKSIGRSAFQNCCSLEQVKLFYGIREIEPWTFSGCSSLQEITLPDGLDVIGHQAFAGCPKLKKIKLLSSRTSLGYDVFDEVKECVVEVPAYSGEGLWPDLRNRLIIEEDPNTFSVDGIRYRVIDEDKRQVVVFRNEDFVGHANLNSIVTLASGKQFDVVEIDKEAFKGNKWLTSIHIPSSIKMIGGLAFADCLGMEYFTTDEDVDATYSALNGVLFRNDEGKSRSVLVAYPAANDKTTYSIPNSVERFEDYAFSSFRNLQRITFASESMIEAILENPNVFTDANLSSCIAFVPSTTKEDFKNKLREIGFKDIQDSDFFQLDNINYKIIEEGNAVEVSDNKSFEGEAVIPATVRFAGTDYKVTRIGNKAFQDSGITAIHWAEDSNVTEIRDSAFSGCDIQITFPSSIKAIGMGAFSGNRFQTMNIPVGVEKIGDHAFYKSQLFGDTKVEIPEGVVELGTAPFRGCNLESITVSKKNKKYVSVDGVLYTYDKKTLVEFPRNKAVTNGLFNIPDTVEVMEHKSFEGPKVRGLMVPKSMKELKNNVFQDCNSLYLIDIKTDALINTSVFSLSEINESCFIIVPEKQLDNYRNSKYWGGKFKYIYGDKTLPEVEIGIFTIRITSWHEPKAEIIRVSGSGTVNIPSVLEFGLIKRGNSNTLAKKAFESLIRFITLKICANALEGANDISSITIAKDISEIEAGALVPKGGLKSIEVEKGSEHFASKDGVLFDAKFTKLIQYPCSATTTQYILPAEVTSIESKAFSNCNNLTTISIKGPAPKTSEDSFVGDWTKKCTIVVPEKYFDAYSTWKKFGFTIKKEEPEIKKLEYFLKYKKYDSKNKYVEVTGFKVAKKEEELFNKFIVTKPELHIPPTYTDNDETWVVKKIGDNAFKERKQLKVITIPSGVTHIGKSAFKSSGTTITLPDSIEEIGAEGLVGNTVKGTLFPKTFKYLGGMALLDVKTDQSPIYLSQDCTFFDIALGGFFKEFQVYKEIKELKVNDTIIGEKKKYYTSLDGVLLSVLNSEMSICVYPRSKEDKNFKFGQNNGKSYPVKTIERYAFYKAEYLTTLTIPDTVTLIKGCGLCECKQLTTLIIEASNPPKIYDTSFQGLSNLKEILVPDVDKYVKAEFWESFKDIIKPLHPKEPIPATFVKDQIEYKVIDPEKKFVEVKGFFITNKEDEEAVKKISKLELPSSISYNKVKWMVKGIGEKAFCQKYHLKEIIISEGVTYIGNLAFNACGATITLPDSIEEIRRDGLSQNTIKGTLFSSNLKYLRENALWFAKTDQSPIYLSPNAIYEARSLAGEFKAFKVYDTKIEKNKKHYTTSEDGVLFSRINNELSICSYPRLKEDESYTIGQNIDPNVQVKTIESYSFYYAEFLIALAIPSTVTEIKWEGIAYCKKLTKIFILANDPPKIQSASLSSLDNLKEIYVLDVDKYLKDDIWKTFKDKIKKLVVKRPTQPSTPLRR